MKITILRIKSFNYGLKFDANTRPFEHFTNSLDYRLYNNMIYHYTVKM